MKVGVCVCYKKFELAVELMKFVDVLHIFTCFGIVRSAVGAGPRYTIPVRHFYDRYSKPIDAQYDVTAYVRSNF
jgi:hypothetical protein